MSKIYRQRHCKSKTDKDLRFINRTQHKNIGWATQITPKIRDRSCVLAGKHICCTSCTRLFLIINLPNRKLMQFGRSHSIKRGQDDNCNISVVICETRIYSIHCHSVKMAWINLPSLQWILYTILFCCSGPIVRVFVLSSAYTFIISVSLFYYTIKTKRLKKV